MKKIKLLFASLFLLSVVFLASCNKKDIDIRDQYVGTWNIKQTGSITYFHAGDVLETVPIGGNGRISITKSGDNELIINGQVYFVNGTKLSSDPESFTLVDDGINMVGTETQSGQLGDNIITIDSNVTGTWSNRHGATGNFSGTMVSTLTK